jgi:hypothetical protein
MAIAEKRPRVGIEDRELAERVARLEHRQKPARIAARHPDPTGDDDPESLPGLRRWEHDLTLRQPVHGQALALGLLAALLELSDARVTASQVLDLASPDAWCTCD